MKIKKENKTYNTNNTKHQTPLKHNNNHNNDDVVKSGNKPYAIPTKKKKKIL